MKNKPIGKVGVLILATGLFMLLCPVVNADTRTDYLIKMLESGGSYLVKVQAAGSLGKLRAREAIPALKNALNDKDELVVIAAATALGQIGDPSPVPALEEALKKATSTAARTQIGTTLQILRASGTASTVPDETRPASSAPSKAAVYLAKIDAMGNTSSLPGDEAERLLKKAVAESLTALGGVQFQSDGLTESQVKQRLKSERLKGFIVSGSLLKLEWGKNYIEVTISLNVFSNPDYNLLMMPSGGIRVPVGTVPGTAEEKNREQEKAVRRLVDDMLGKVMDALPGVL